MNYCSINDLNTFILRNLHKFPHDIDVVVGIPRSGMLPANLIALYLNKPYTDIDSFIEGKTYKCGERGAFVENVGSNRILVVDDSICKGGAINKAKQKLAPLSGGYSFIYAAIIAAKEATSLVDVYCEIVDVPRCFQWNILHHPYVIPNSCFDIDGVLCEDPPYDDDGLQYTRYIENAIPKYIPTVEINTLVTCRLEKYRESTEKWLKQNNVKYQKLVMLNMKTKQERVKWGKHGKFKGKIYAESPTFIFVESSMRQAIDIVKTSRKPVFCTETFSLLSYNDYRSDFGKIYDRLYIKLRNLASCLLRKIKSKAQNYNYENQDCIYARQ